MINKFSHSRPPYTQVCIMVILQNLTIFTRKYLTQSDAARIQKDGRVENGRKFERKTFAPPFEQKRRRYFGRRRSERRFRPATGSAGAGGSFRRTAAVTLGFATKFRLSARRAICGQSKIGQ